MGGRDSPKNHNAERYSYAIRGEVAATTAGWMAAETHKNGHTARADAGSIGPGALDQESAGAHSPVRSHEVTRGRLSEPRLWQGRQNTGSPVRWTPLRDGWGGPRSLSTAAADLMAAHSALSDAGHTIEGARAYAPSIGTGALAFFRAA